MAVGINWLGTESRSMNRAKGHIHCEISWIESSRAREFEKKNECGERERKKRKKREVSETRQTHARRGIAVRYSLFMSRDEEIYEWRFRAVHSTDATGVPKPLRIHTYTDIYEVLYRRVAFLFIDCDRSGRRSEREREREREGGGERTLKAGISRCWHSRFDRKKKGRREAGRRKESGWKKTKRDETRECAWVREREREWGREWVRGKRDRVCQGEAEESNRALYKDRDIASL